MTTKAADALMSIFGFESVTLRGDGESGTTEDHELEVVMSNKMREDFEEWRVDNFCGGIERLKKCSNASNVYYYEAEQAAWRTWKASRAALAVELPARWKDSNMMFDSEVIADIHAAGVKTK